MREPINYQIIEQNGEPAFAVVPYDEFKRLIGGNDTVPNEVAKMAIVDDMSLIKAWRKHKNLTQTAVAKRMGITQPSYAQIEKGGKPHEATLVKFAEALSLSVEQVREFD